MSQSLEQYPDIVDQLDPTLGIESVREGVRDEQRTLEVVQTGEFEAERSLFVWRQDRWQLEDDGIEAERNLNLWNIIICNASNAEDHQRVYDEVVRQVGRDTSEGPGGGNLACVWAVRLSGPFVTSFMTPLGDGSRIRTTPLHFVPNL